MTEHAVAFLQIPVRIVGSAFDGLADGRIESYALVGAAIGLLLVLATLRKSGASDGFQDAVLPAVAAPSAAWEAEADAATLRALASSETEAARAVLTADTPGGGE